MSSRANTVFYLLSAFVLMTAVFVMKPSNIPEVSALQTEMKSQFALAFQQVMGDQPYFDDVILVFQGVEEFYQQAATASIALYEDKEADREIAQLFGATYDKLVATVTSYIYRSEAATVATMPATPTIEAERDVAAYEIQYEAAVSGAFVDNTPVNAEKPWVTIQDNFTNQLYCLAIYNGEVNKYLGPCKDDYH